MARSISLDDEYIFSVHIQSPEYLTDGGDRNGAQDTKNDGNLAKNGKKRGTIFTCESCSKVPIYVVLLQQWNLKYFYCRSIAIRRA